MADDEDDYLSDKFLALPSPSSSQPTTYAERRKQAKKKSQFKNEQNKVKTRKERELDSREEGLGKSLFQRAQEEAIETGKQNKALAIMMKMGFQPGQSLGGIDAATTTTAEPSPSPPGDAGESGSSTEPPSRFQVQHRVEPLPIKEWTGKTGIGGVKRPPSPRILERASKVAKQAEQLSADQFRDRARQEYEERRDEGRLRHLQTTCVTLDTKEGIKFNCYWLDPTDPESFPPGLLTALEDLWMPPAHYIRKLSYERGDSVEARLRSQMQADALQPLPVEDDDRRSILQATEHWAEETLSDVAAFLGMNAPERLTAVVNYLRNQYNYCFWCGTQYASVDEMNELCPGQGEDEHD